MRETRPLVIALVVLIGLVVLSATTMGGMMGGGIMGPGMMWGYPGQGGATAIGGWPAAVALGFGWLMMLVFWGALIVGVVLLLRWVAGGSVVRGAGEDAVTILQRRYAAGEIDEETYRRMRRELDPVVRSVESHGEVRRAG
jgi:putative membrane protein